MACSSPASAAWRVRSAMAGMAWAAVVAPPLRAEPAPAERLGIGWGDRLTDPAAQFDLGRPSRRGREAPDAGRPGRRCENDDTGGDVRARAAPPVIFSSFRRRATQS